MNSLPKIVVILGPTASGKTDLGIALAKKFNGEIISADSRQVYKKMSIGTAKPEGKWTKDKSAYVVEGIPHFMMDIVDPGTDFSLADFKTQAISHINDILRRGKLPIIVGGTGLYIWALVDNLDIPKVEPHKKLRQEMEKEPLSKLVAQLKKIDPESAKQIDLNNPRRVLRALEVFITSGESFFKQRTKSDPLYDALEIGINPPRAELYKRIGARVDQQIKDGLVEEVTKLVKQKYGWNLPSMSGIGYKQIGYFLRGEKTLPEAIEILKRDTRRYAKKQMTWFKRDNRIHWLDKPNIKEAEKLFIEHGFVAQKV